MTAEGTGALCPFVAPAAQSSEASRMPLPRSLSLALAAAAMAVACAGCGGGASTRDAGFVTMGMPGIPSPTRVGVNLVFADVAVDGHPGGRLGVDTGSPIMLVDASKFPGLVLPPAVQVTADLTLGQFTVNDVPLVQYATGGGMDPLNFAGLLGGNVMQQFSVRFDYANPDRAFRLGMPEMEMERTGVTTPGTAIPFNLEGGGRGRFESEVIDFPATRIPLTVDVEGVPHPFILDTGASETTVRTSVYEVLMADGRGELTGLPIGTVSGPTTASVTRARSLTVAGETVANPAVMTIGDMIIDGIETEVGHPVDGLLGGNFLREFMVTIDYPRRTLHLQRYTSIAIVDEFKRVGIELAVAGGAHRYRVGTVYAGTDAALKQLSVDDEIVSIDGRALDPLDSITADGLLSGTVGATLAIGLGTARVAALSNTTVGVLIDDLIPAP
jgi:hypothetical protein